MRCWVKKKLFDKEKLLNRWNSFYKTITLKNEQIRWFTTGVFLSIACAFVLTCLYQTFRARSGSEDIMKYETQSKIELLTETSYVLYHDLYNKVNSTNADYHQIYLHPKEEYSVLDDFSESNELIESTEEMPEEDSSHDMEYEESIALEEIQNHQAIMYNYFNQLEDNFDEVNAMYDYWIEDLDTGVHVSNISEDVKNYYEKGNVYFRLKILYDAHGNATIEDATGLDYSQIRKNATHSLRDNNIYQLFERYGVESQHGKYYSLSMPQNCRIIYYVSLDTYWDLVAEASRGFEYADAEQTFYLFTLVMLVLALIWPWGKDYKPWENYKLLRMPIEGLGCVFLVWSIFASEAVSVRAYGSAYAYTMWDEGMYASWLYEHFMNMLLLVSLFAMTWYVGICIRSAVYMGLGNYCKQRIACLGFCRYCKEKIVQMYDNAMHWDLNDRSKKMVFKIVFFNAIILFIISSLWFGGFAITIIYSIILYIVLRKAAKDIQEKYNHLLSVTNEMAEGNLDVNIVEDMGIFEPFKPQLIRIQRGFKNAVEQEVKSQKMKAELITNVSHDLKTPLTAIITYISLLQDENITSEQRKEYLDTLYSKSLRLKVLIEDLFEVSKANSQNLKLDLQNVDLMNLIKQVSYEMSDKMEGAKLDVRLNLPEKKAQVMLDSQKTYRIYENLFSNIAKYAMSGTRVYITGIITEDSVIITLKNITAQELTVSAEDLTARFVRGDSSRNTEGSGLGLAIAKSFTELQGGKFNIELDDDIFKVITIFKLNNE